MTVPEEFYLALIKAGKMSVTKDGIVINLVTGRRIGSFANGYWSISWRNPETLKMMKVQTHRLMWLLFCGEISSSHYLVPIDGDNRNLHIDNYHLVLKGEWTKKCAVGAKRHVVNDKLTVETVAEARRLYRKGGVSLITLAKKYDVSKTTMLFAINGTHWKHCSEPPAILKEMVVDDSKMPKTMNSIRKLVAKNYSPRRIADALIKKKAAMPRKLIRAVINFEKRKLKEMELSV